MKERDRILRATRYLEWFTFADAFDLIGGGDERRRTRAAKALERLATAGLFERRRVTVGFASAGARWEYQMTDLGRAAFKRLLAKAAA